MTDNKTLDDLATGELPEVKQNAIDAIHDVAQEKAKEENNSKPDGFDPEIHATGDDGKPQYTKTGKLKKKRGRKKGASNSTLNLGNPEKEKEEFEQRLSSLETATTISGMLEMAQYKMISNEFIYSEMERTANIQAWANTLDYYGGVNLTPPQTLALSHMQIILTRAMSEKSKTRAKFGLGMAWFKNKFANLRSKGKNKNGAHVNSGENSIGENDASNKDSKKNATKGNKNNSSRPVS